MHTYEWTWTRDDHIRAHRDTTKNALGLHRFSWLPLAIVLAIAVSPILLRGKDGAAAMLPALAPWLALLVVWLVLLHYGLPRLAANRLAKHDPSTTAPIRHTISPDGFGIRSQAASVDLTWAHIKQVVETPHFMLYYYSPNCAYFTPVRAIPAPEFPSLRQTITTAIGSRARLRTDKPLLRGDGA